MHVYSLVHDDLPAMDDDDLRRGRPTCHKAYDEATAILVGDALQPLAFQLLARDPALPAVAGDPPAPDRPAGEASGTFGMAGGQAIDLAVQGRQLDIGAGRGHARAQDRRPDPGQRADGGRVRARRSTPRSTQALARLRDRRSGSHFRSRTTCSMCSAMSSTLGKATGADRERAKPTHPAIIGIAASQERVRRLHAQAMESLAPFGARADALRGVTDWLLARRN